MNLKTLYKASQLAQQAANNKACFEALTDGIYSVRGGAYPDQRQWSALRLAMANGFVKIESFAAVFDEAHKGSFEAWKKAEADFQAIQ